MSSGFKLQHVIIRDPGTRWDGAVTKILAGGGRMERSLGTGFIGVYAPTGEEVELTDEYEVRGGRRKRTVKALVYARVGLKRAPA